MITKPMLRVGAAVLLAVLLSACDSGVTVYEPGVYKGGKDANASQQAAESRSNALRDRAGSAFTDR
ncbi:MAG TPA: hypothetical protein VFY81_12000 [Gammaproteobacteria bacterium]|jgi:hypothetical protein|nr:hypothetical protein [Gammaproteobacteria bacterium]